MRALVQGPREPLVKAAVCRPVLDADGEVVDLLVESMTDSYRETLLLDLRATLGDLPVAGRTFGSLLPWSRHDGTLRAMCRVATTGRPFQMTRPGALDGSRPARRVSVRRDGERILVLSRDVDVLEHELERYEAEGPRWRRAFAQAPVGVGVSSYAGDIIEVNDELCRLLGRDRDELVGGTYNRYSHPDDIGVRVDREVLHAEGRYELRKRYLTAAGRVVWTRMVTTYVEEAGEVRALSFVEDIGEAVAAQSEMLRMATQDELTGLPNRSELRRLLREALEAGRHGRAPHPALLYADLDHFKVVNDSLGHDAGDQLLRRVAGELSGAVGTRGTVGRLGGDEFVVMVRDRADAPSLATELVHLLRGSVRLGGRDVTVGVSIGLAEADGDTSDDSLLRDADTALYAAKRAGRGRVVAFDAQLRGSALARLEDEAALRHGLVAGELVTHYQPVLDTRGRLRSLEALVRWQHPERGLLPPGAFLAMAEETGLVVDLGRVVLGQAMLDLVRWRAVLPRLRVSVNVAPQHLMGGTLIDDVGLAVAASGLTHEALVLELTESALAAGPGITSTLQQLRSLGCLLALDDFGTGYSSLAYLRDFPVDVLKVDRSFIAGSASARGGTLLDGICTLGRSLGFILVTEGIETEREQATAIAAGTDLLQGYLLGRPVAAPEVDRLVAGLG